MHTFIKAMEQLLIMGLKRISKVLADSSCTLRIGYAFVPVTGTKTVLS